MKKQFSPPSALSRGGAGDYPAPEGESGGKTSSPAINGESVFWTGPGVWKSNQRILSAHQERARCSGLGV